jgi:hypothetical protein
MFEPMSVAAEIVSLALVAGTRPDCTPVVNIQDFAHAPMAGSTVWPAATPTPAVFAAVPANQCYIVTFISAVVTAADESEQAVDAGVNFNATASLTSLSASSATDIKQLTGDVPWQSLLNGPCLFVFEAGRKPRLVVNATGSTQAASSRRLLLRLNGYLAPADYLTVYKRFQTAVAT